MSNIEDAHGGGGPWAAREGQAGDRQFPCEQCGAKLVFKPGTGTLTCMYCGHQNHIPVDAVQVQAAIQELDLEEALRADAGAQPTVTRDVVKCQTCAAEFTLDAKVTASECPFCGSPIVRAETQRIAILQPRAVLPFKVDKKEAVGHFRKWLGSLWFAPSKLARFAREDGGLAGMYVPYWTYDAATISHYTGQRGDDYTVSVPYTTTENGQTVTRTRTETRTRWTSVSGRVDRDFDDVLVLASDSLPYKQTDALEPWDLENLVPYDESYLSGFRAERYHVDLGQGFTVAKGKMEEVIRGDVRRDIGGDKQRIDTLATQHNDVTYKHILLPVWLAAYRFQDKVYRFVVNARTGEVQGERPWSWIKIGLAVAAVIVIGVGAYFAFAGQS
ncbi:hypothetical protein [Zavarzinia sp. CC-PAN008]|uniref:hypothetical protein n=1 Tax=Zavarzinia sp. CC-PAN008 TaxID=3243332 RepID=UPI003F743943